MKPSKTSRRAFLSAGLMIPAAGAGARLGLGATTTGTLRPADAAFEDAPTSVAKLPMRILGRTGLKVNPVGFGCGYTPDPSIIERAIDIGINYFDTARAYLQGNSERLLAAGIGAKRKQVVLSTKTLASDKANALKDLDTSLLELKTDFVDVWYFHDKPDPGKITDGMIEAQQVAKQQGKARFVGFTGHKHPDLHLKMLSHGYPFDAVQMPLTTAETGRLRA